jgi:hypothetical protein
MKAGATLGIKDPRLVRARVSPTVKCHRSAVPSGLERPGNFEKDVKIEGTNSASLLESTKLSKKRTQNAPKLSRKSAENMQKSPKKHDCVELCAAPMLFTWCGHNVTTEPFRRDAAALRIERTNRECP